MHRTFISQMERGLKAPSLTTVFKLAEALDVSPTVMVEGVRTRLRGMN
jgi:transcriptional regulator with XRE-family HTH domain